MKFAAPKKIPALVLALILIPISHALGQKSEDAYSVSRFAVNDGVKLDVRTSGGPIEVMGRDVDEVTVEMYVRRKGKYVTEQTDLGDWEIDISKDGNTITAHAKREGNWRWNNNNISIGFVVYAPVASASELRTSGGSIRLGNLKGSQTARTSGGSVNAEGIEGSVELRT